MPTISRAKILLVVGAALVAVELLIVVAATWIYVMTFGREFDAGEAPSAPVAIVLGSKVSDGEPGSYVGGRLDTAITLYRSGRVAAILNSGNGRAEAGDEPAVMHSYLTERGVPAEAVVDDSEGYDTAATCRRAREVFDVTEALIVTQDFHLGRAIALCRDAGIDTRGVVAECDCATWTVVRNHLRENLLAAPRALLTVLTN